MSPSISLKNKVVWAITGSGDEINEILDTMIDLGDKFRDVEIRVYVSKAGEQVLRMYSIFDDLQAAFPVVKVEKNSNIPFLIGELQSHKYDFMIVAPATSNTTAKIALGLGDSLIPNAVNMATKAKIPVYVLPCEVGEGSTVTVLPDGSELELVIRKIDSEHIGSLRRMEYVTVLRAPGDLINIFYEHYSSKSNVVDR